MLTFVNRCTNPECGHRFETEQKISDPTRPDCPRCGAATRRELQPAPFRLLGDCWGDTGYSGEQGWGIPGG